jgi:hypothetical protein
MSEKTQCCDDRLSPPPAFPAQWVDGLYAFSPVSGRVSHRRLAFVIRDLIPASGDQDRAISPYAPARSPRTPPRPSHPAANVRDDRETPLWWRRDGADHRPDLRFW